MSLMGEPRPLGSEFELWMRSAFPALLERSLKSHLSTEHGVVTMMQDAFYEGVRRARAEIVGKPTPS